MAFDRRNFLRAAALLPIAVRELVAAPSKYMLQMNGYAADAETPLELLTDYLTRTISSSCAVIGFRTRPTQRLGS